MSQIQEGLGTAGIRAVIFDFGGVLMRTGDPAGRREWEGRLGLAAGELERRVHGSEVWLQAQRGAITYDDYWAALADSLRLAPNDIRDMRAAYFRDDRLDLNLIALIHALHREGCKVALLSNETTELETKLRHELHIYDAFDAVLISAKIGIMKPAAGAYQAVVAALQVDPSACVFIDDMPANVDGAIAFGLKAIRFRPEMNLRATLDDLIGRLPS